ncbi:hypothetical protein SVIOM74S_07848 [Streptomyces violarus]
MWACQITGSGLLSGALAVVLAGALDAGPLAESEVDGWEVGGWDVGGCEVGGWDVGGCEVGGLDVVGGFDVVGGLDVVAQTGRGGRQPPRRRCPAPPTRTPRCGPP